MTYHYWIDTERQVVFQRVIGRVTDDDLVGEFKLRSGKMGHAAGFSMLCDYRRADTRPLTPAGVERALQVIRSTGADTSLDRWAVVAPPDVLYALSRMFSTFMSALGHDSHVYRFVDEARAQLGLPPEADDDWQPVWMPPLPSADGEGFGAGA